MRDLRLPAAVLAVLWAAFLFRMSDQPGNRVSIRLPGPVSNLTHAAVHAVLAILVLRAIVPWGAPVRWPGLGSRAAAGTLAVVLVHALQDEIHQHFVAYRTCSVIDVLLDVSGAVLVFLAVPGRGVSRSRRILPAAGILVLAVILAWLGTLHPWPDGVLADLLSAAGLEAAPK